MVSELTHDLACGTDSCDVAQAVAQGRVWTGKRAIERKLVDVLGGLHEAVALVKQAAGIEQAEKVTLVEVTRGRTSPLSLIGECNGWSWNCSAAAAGRCNDHLPLTCCALCLTRWH